MPDVAIEQYNDWLADGGPVALVIRQWLVPATQPDDIIFPPSYANPSEKEGDPPVYNIDGEGRESVCVLDSIPSQANRMEPMFATPKYKDLVPQIQIKFKDGLIRNLLEIGHRIADAAFRGTELDPKIKEALQHFKQGNAVTVARLAPTSLVFGAWDSRDSGVKIPRLVNSIIRARGVVQLRRSAQYTPAINYEREGLLPENLGGKPSKFGLADAPSVHKIGGVQINGEIIRDASLNLASLRCLRGTNAQETLKLQRYILGLSLVAAAAEPDLNLRQGCLLTLNPEKCTCSHLVMRNGQRTEYNVTPDVAAEFAQAAARDFGVSEEFHDPFEFSPKRMKERLKAGSKKGKKHGDVDGGGNGTNDGPAVKGAEAK